MTGECGDLVVRATHAPLERTNRTALLSARCREAQRIEQSRALHQQSHLRDVAAISRAGRAPWDSQSLSFMRAEGEDYIKTRERRKSRGGAQVAAEITSGACLHACPPAWAPSFGIAKRFGARFRADITSRRRERKTERKLSSSSDIPHRHLRLDPRSARWRWGECRCDVSLMLALWQQVEVDGCWRTRRGHVVGLITSTLLPALITLCTVCHRDGARVTFCTLQPPSSHSRRHGMCGCVCDNIRRAVSHTEESIQFLFNTDKIRRVQLSKSLSSRHNKALKQVKQQISLI